MTDENEYSAKVILKIGPIKAKFSGSVTLDTTNAPERLTLSGSDEGGIAGFAKGGSLNNAIVARSNLYFFQVHFHSGFQLHHP